MIEPLGFRLSDKEIKRAGMDYWYQVDVTTYESYTDFLSRNPECRIFMATTKSRQMYTEVTYEENCYIMFGKESAGIPEELLLQNKSNCIRIPMLPDIRSLNLANSVAIVAYEAMRQQDFQQFQREGQLHRFEW